MMLNKFSWVEVNHELLLAYSHDKHSSKDGKDGKEGKDDISAIPDMGEWV